MKLLKKLLKKPDLDLWLFRAMIVLPLTTVINRVGGFGFVNKGIMCFVLIGTCLSVLLQCSLPVFRVFSVSLCCCALGLVQCTDFNFSINDVLYYPVWVCVLIWFVVVKDKVVHTFVKDKDWISGVVLLWHFAVFASLFYLEAYTQRGKEPKFFSSFASGHRFSSACFAIIVLCWLLFRIEKRVLWVFFGCLAYAYVLLSYSRVYFLTGAAVVACMVWNSFSHRRGFWWMAVLGACVAVGIFPFTPMMKKIMFTINGNPYLDGALNRFTSGRFTFWVYDVQELGRMCWLERLLGGGAGRVYAVNREMMGMNIYAHNDYLNVVLGYGVIGLLVYFWVYWLVRQAFLSKCGWIERMCLFIVVFGNAFLNGLYVYPCVVVTLPILMLVLSRDDVGVS